MPITNKSGINLLMAVWAIHDDYDYIDEPNYISATRLLRPLKHIILPSRVPLQERISDVEDFIARALGTAIHSGIENAWQKGYKRALKLLGYPDEVIERIRINPTDEELRASNSIIPVYFEQRTFRKIEVNGVEYTIGGKFDTVAEGIVHDNKSTSAYTWLYGTRDEEHALQGSIYRWLDPKKITEDYMRVNYIFTDWKKIDARSNPNYPQQRLLPKEIPLLSEAQTETWIRNKIALVQKYKDCREEDIPECTDEELWRSEPVFKYFADPNKTDGRSTKNFASVAEANQHRSEKGKGIVISVPGEVKRCGYCDAFPICKQKDRYFGQP